MAVELIEIVNPNGRKGKVAATSRAAATYKQPPSARRADRSGEDARGDSTQRPTVAIPGGNASTDDWRAFGLAQGLTSEQVESMSRDELRDHFTPES